MSDPWTHERSISIGGMYVLFYDGASVGTVSLVSSIHGVELLPDIRMGSIISALNSFDQGVFRGRATAADRKYMAAGWRSRAQYLEQIEAIKIVLADQPPHVSAAVERAWASKSWTLPLTPGQMAEWTATVDEAIADADDEAAA